MPHRTHRYFRLLALAFAFLPISRAWAATITVSPGQSISAALATAAPGDVIDVRAGIYPEILSSYTGTRWPSGTAQARITVQGHPGETVVLRPGPHDLLAVIAHASYLTLDNLTFDGRAGSNTVVKLDEGSHHIRLQNSVILGNSPWTSNGVLAGGEGQEIVGNDISGSGGYGVYNTGHDNVISGNYVHDNQGYGIHVYRSGGSDVSNNQVLDNLVTHNGFGNQNPAGSCAILLASGANNRARGNIVDGQDGCGVQVYANMQGAIVELNTIANVRGACVQDDGRGTVQGQNTCTNDASAAIAAWQQGKRLVPGGRPPVIPVPTNLRAVVLPAR